jgi:DNA-directed RNA polymerase I subunit RPA2
MVSSPHKQRVPAPKSRAVQTCPSHTSGTLPTLADVERLRKLTDPHVDSFNYFLEEGLSRGFQGMEPAEIALADPTTLRDDPESIDLSETTTVRFWIEGVKTAKPVKGSPGGRTREKLLPRECRERSMMYAGTMRGMFCYCIVDRRNGMDFPGKTVKLSKEFGDMPIMAMSTACHLHKSTPKQLAGWKEEVCRVFH